ncbi:MAG TPA: DUF2891 domain-containing protein [Thermoanaerobaculia bacterium]
MKRVSFFFLILTLGGAPHLVPSFANSPTRQSRYGDGTASEGMPLPPSSFEVADAPEPLWRRSARRAKEEGEGEEPRLNSATAERFAKLALACIDREYPNKPEHVLDSAPDARPPRDFHPAFFGCYDWQSSVHGHWMLVRLLKTFPDLPARNEIRARLAAHFTGEAIATEARYLDIKSNKSFERTYGWAWTLRLATELATWDDPDAKAWRANLDLLAKTIVARLKDFLPKLTYPIRTGVHPNTAFALGEALDYARVAGDADLAALVTRRAREYYENDRACPLAYEPSGEDFFSPCLEEADLMRRVMPPEDFVKWLHVFLPGLSAGKAFPLSPAVVTDRTDPRLVHLDGLNLTRSWTLRAIARALPASDSRRKVLEKSVAEHAAAGLARVSSGNYEGEHWLASFAVYLLTDTGRS